MGRRGDLDTRWTYLTLTGCAFPSRQRYWPLPCCRHPRRPRRTPSSIRADDLVEGKERFEIRVSDGVGLRPQRGRTTIVIDDVGH
jgi:hypothetical protein